MNNNTQDFIYRLMSYN